MSEGSPCPPGEGPGPPEETEAKLDIVARNEDERKAQDVVQVAAPADDAAVWARPTTWAELHESLRREEDVCDALRDARGRGQAQSARPEVLPSMDVARTAGITNLALVVTLTTSGNVAKP